MAETWHVTETPGRKYLDWVRRTHRVFSEPAWESALTALGASPVYAWNDARGFGALIARFRFGPFRVGVCGQPVAGRDWDMLATLSAKEACRQLCSDAGLDVLRVNRSMQDDVDSEATAARPEAWIDDIQAYDIEASKRLRKDLAFARRAAEGANRVVAGFDAVAAYQLYASTVSRHGGVLRYSPAYFGALAELASKSSALQLFSVPGKDGRMLGFSVLAIHAGVAHYLHGATSGEGRREGVTDLLIDAMLSATADAEIPCFTLMASPWEQPGLMAFKEKWSNRKGFSVTHDVPGSAFGRIACSWLRWKSRSDIRAAQAKRMRTPHL